LVAAPEVFIFNPMLSLILSNEAFKKVKTIDFEKTEILFFFLFDYLMVQNIICLNILIVLCSFPGNSLSRLLLKGQKL